MSQLRAFNTTSGAFEHINSDGNHGLQVTVASLDPYPLTPIVTAYTPSTTAYLKVTPNALNLDMVVRPRTVTDSLIYAGIVTHKVADATTLAATKPASAGAQAYALSIELADDLHTHVVSTAYHVVADTALTTTNATDEASLVAEVNLIRLKLLSHLASTSVHGGVADATNLATVAATSASTDAATALTLLNTIYPAHVAHLLLSDNGAYATLPAGGALSWACAGSFFARTSTSGGTFTCTEFRSA